MTTGIYKITNKKDGKSYIGQSIHIERRWMEHRQPSANSMIAKAIRKHGEKNFELEILEVCPRELLGQREEYYIDHFNTITPYGYNIATGTQENSSNFTIYNKKEFEEMVEDIKHSDLLLKDIATKYGISRITVNGINKGKSHYDPLETYPLRPLPQPAFCLGCGKKISRKNIRCGECHVEFMRKAVRPEPLELARMVKEKGFLSVGNSFGVTDNTIKKWCKDYKIPHLKKELINWYNEQVGIPPKPQKVLRRLTGVIQKDLEGNLLNSFDSLNDAAIFLQENKLTKGIKDSVKTCLARAADGKRKTYCNFKWEWISPPEEYII